MSAGLIRSRQCVEGRARAPYRRGIIFRARSVVEVVSARDVQPHWTGGDDTTSEPVGKGFVSHRFLVNSSARHERTRRPHAACPVARPSVRSFPGLLQSSASTPRSRRIGISTLVSWLKPDLVGRVSRVGRALPSSDEHRQRNAHLEKPYKGPRWPFRGRFGALGASRDRAFSKCSQLGERALALHCKRPGPQQILPRSEGFGMCAVTRSGVDRAQTRNDPG